jgi:hydrogenase maturation factor
MSYIRLILPDENDVNFEGVVAPETYTTNNGEYVLVRVGETLDVTDDAAGHHEVAVTQAWYERNPRI